MITTTHDSDLQEPGHVQPKAKSRIGLIIASSTVAGKFGVAPLPGLNGPGRVHSRRPQAGHRNLRRRLHQVRVFGGGRQGRYAGHRPAHVNRALYSDPDILKKFPHYPILLKSIETAKPRPKVVNYGDATLAMQDAATSALQGQVPPEAALSELQSKLESLTK